MHSVVAIMNPRADRGRSADLFQRLRATLAERCDLELLQTTGRGHAVRLAQQTGGAEMVLAVGGDGTVHEVVNGLMQLPVARRPVLGILPVGSGNDVAYAAGISRNLAETAERVMRRATRPLDVGQLHFGGALQRYWVCNVGLLLDGEINRLSHRLHWPKGSGLYLRAALQRLLRRPQVSELELVVDGSVLTDRAMSFSIGNGPRSGGRFLLTPTAQIDDGRGHFVYVRPVGRWKLVRLMLRSLHGNHLQDPHVGHGDFSRLTLRSDRPLVAHVDGEPLLSNEDGVVEATFQMQAGALRLLR